MNQQTRDAIVEALEQVMKALGEPSYDAGAAKLCEFAHGFAQIAELAKSKEHLRGLLDLVPDFDDKEVGIAVFATSSFPQLMAMTLPDLVHKFASEFIPRSGRPKSLKHSQSIGLLKRISYLELQGYSRSIAMRSAAREFHVSFRTVQRTWENRKRIFAGEREYTVQEALEWIGGKMARNGGKQIPDLISANVTRS